MSNVEEFLKNHGYTQYPVNSTMQQNASGFFQKEVKTIPCLLNDKTHINVTLYDYHINGHHIVQASADIVGEAVKDTWSNLQFYSLSFEDLENKLEMFEQKLIKAWEAIH